MQGGKDAGSEGVLGVYLGEWQIVLMCLSLSVFFFLLPSTPLLIDKEEEEERDEEGVEIFLMSSVILNSVFAVWMKLQVCLSESVWTQWEEVLF